MGCGDTSMCFLLGCQGCDPSWPTVAGWTSVLVQLQEVMGILSLCGSVPLWLCPSVAVFLWLYAPALWLLSSEAPKLKN